MNYTKVEILVIQLARKNMVCLIKPFTIFVLDFKDILKEFIVQH